VSTASPASPTAAPAGGNEAARAAAIALIAWARVWSPLATPAERDEAWQALGLPAAVEDAGAAYWSTFHAALPVPRVPLLLHAALGREGAQLREELTRVASFLQLRWRDRILPPDHLAAACELLAAALENGDDRLAAELRHRYLQPWCAVARTRLTADASPLLALVDTFAQDLDPPPSPPARQT
jgi:nitrate reductase assembly molybdenum cofactor insertion protein NarJ